MTRTGDEIELKILAKEYLLAGSNNNNNFFFWQGGGTEGAGLFLERIRKFAKKTSAICSRLDVPRALIR